MPGFYMSACCRSEIYLNSGQAHPLCPGCENPAEWLVLARSGGDPRRYPRHGDGNQSLYAAYAVLNGSRIDNVRIVNFSRRGMAIELPSSVPISTEARLQVRRIWRGRGGCDSTLHNERCGVCGGHGDAWGMASRLAAEAAGRAPIKRSYGLCPILCPHSSGSESSPGRRSHRRPTACSAR